VTSTASKETRNSDNRFTFNELAVLYLTLYLIYSTQHVADAPCTLKLLAFMLL